MVRILIIKKNVQSTKFIKKYSLINNKIKMYLIYQ